MAATAATPHAAPAPCSFNADWGYAVALPAADLERQLRDGRARRLSGGSLFDRAAAAALDRIARR